MPHEPWPQFLCCLFHASQINHSFTSPMVWTYDTEKCSLKREQMTLKHIKNYRSIFFVSSVCSFEVWTNEWMILAQIYKVIQVKLTIRIVSFYVVIYFKLELIMLKIYLLLNSVWNPNEDYNALPRNRKTQISVQLSVWASLVSPNKNIILYVCRIGIPQKETGPFFNHSFIHFIFYISIYR